MGIKGKAMILPVQWGKFDLALHTWYELIDRVTWEANKRGVFITAPKLGKLISIQQNYLQEEWWLPMIESTK